jgi:hypothetical protein
MAGIVDINIVRLNVDESTETLFSDDSISALVDALGVNGASAAIWRQKAARFSAMVDVSEAGASRKMSGLYANALAMAREYDRLLTVEIAAATGTGPIVTKIVRQ